MFQSIRARLTLSLLAAAAVVVAASAIYAELQPVDPALRDELRELVAFTGALLVLASLALAELIARRFAAPLAELRETADALARGEFAHRVRSRRDDEIGAIGRVLDGMADQLADRVEAVRVEENRLRVMLDAMTEAVIVTDPQGRVVLSNKAFVRLTGSPGTGRTSIETIRSAELHDAVTRALGGERVKVSFRIDTGREMRVLSAQVAPLPDEAGAIAVMRDVTELRRLDEVRRDFVANASHELRTPLTAIRGFAETLRDGALDEPRIAKRFVENIVDNAMRLQRLVDDLLELSRSESPDARIELEALDPREVASRVLAALEQKASDKGVALELEGEPVLVRADERALDQILINLVDNAIKYTPSGGRVTVRFAAEGARGRIEVADTGIGISPTHLPRIFERFYRADAGRSREQGGTGLGLAIVKHLTQRMGGEVSVESRLGRGTTFTVRLARAEAGGPAAASEGP